VAIRDGGTVASDVSGEDLGLAIERQVVVLLRYDDMGEQPRPGAPARDRVVWRRAASALAKRHVSYGAKAEHYPVVGAALLWTLEKGLGDGWTPEVADAWGTAYGTLSGYMISEAYGRSQAPSKDIP
jgi:hypothetical protein